MEREEMLREVEGMVGAEKWEGEGPEGVLGSADQLFSRIKESLRRCQALSTGSMVAEMHGAYSEVTDASRGSTVAEMHPRGRHLARPLSKEHWASIANQKALIGTEPV